MAEIKTILIRGARAEVKFSDGNIDFAEKCPLCGGYHHKSYGEVCPETEKNIKQELKRISRANKSSEEYIDANLHGWRNKWRGRLASIGALLLATSWYLSFYPFNWVSIRVFAIGTLASVFPWLFFWNSRDDRYRKKVIKEAAELRNSILSKGVK